jgi:hypothetical protein
MSDTPETDAQLTNFLSISKLGKHFTNRTGTVNAEFARTLERERDEARIQYRSTLALAEALTKTQIELKKERDEQTAQMCQAVGYLSTIAEDCDAWLNNQCDETACEFIKAVRDYAKKGIDA